MRNKIAVIPESWVWADLPEICEIVRGITFPASAKSAEPRAELVPCLRTSNVQVELELADLIYVDRSFVRREEQWVRADDIVMSMANSHELVGKVALAKHSEGEMTFGGFLSVFRPRGVDPRFVFFALRSKEGREALRRRSSRTVNISNLSLKRLTDLRLPVPPLNEQRRIVAKIEALQARSRRAREALEAVPPLLEKFRQSVLAAAFRGDLTADWRAKNPDVEPAFKLLERIRIERRRRWEEAELAKMNAKGNPPKNDSWKSKYQEPAPVDPTGLPELPEGWCWASLNQLSEPTRPLCYGVVQPGPEVEDGVPLIRVCDLLDGQVNDSDARTISRDVDEQYRRSRIEGGEVLISVVGTIGRIAKASVSLRGANIARAVARYVPIDGVTPDWIALALRTPRSQDWLLRGSREVARKTLNLAVLQEAIVPLAPAEEACRVVATIARAITAAEAIATERSSAIRNLASLDESIFAKAFRGELVPQDPKDESARTILCHIRYDSGSPEYREG